MPDNQSQKRKFTADVMLGGLAQYLLLAGIDCSYFKEIEDPALANHAREEERILLSRDQKLIRDYDGPTEAVLVESTDPDTQFKNMVNRFQLTIRPETIFTRCSKCNVLLEDVAKEEIFEQIPRETRDWIDRYKQCPECNQIYWKGSHHEQVLNTFREMDVLSSD